MTDSEKRRMELLRKTRSLYNETRIPPAVHPRYQSFYTKLYDSEETSETVSTKSTFGIRMFISILLFALFVVFDYHGTEYAEVDSQKIIKEIERNEDIMEPIISETIESVK